MKSNFPSEWEGSGYSKASWEGVAFLLKKWILPIMDGTELEQGARVLECGIGSGKWSAAFALLNCEVYAMDFCEEILEMAKSNFPNIKMKYVLKDAREMTYRNKFDLITSEGVFEHFLDDEERSLVLSNWYKALKKGGYLLVIIPNESKEKGELSFTVEGLKKEVENSGFTTQKTFSNSFISADGKTEKVMIGVLSRK